MLKKKTYILVILLCTFMMFMSSVHILSADHGSGGGCSTGYDSDCDGVPNSGPRFNLDGTVNTYIDADDNDAGTGSIGQVTQRELNNYNNQGSNPGGGCQGVPGGGC